VQKLAEICIRRPVFATMLIVALVVLGVNSYSQLGVDLFPKIEFPTITVTTTLRGAAPEEVETEVTQRIEEAVNTLSGIDDLRSVSAEGVSQVFITFVLEKNADVAAQETRDRVAAVMRDLPRDVDPPVVEKMQTDAMPVLSIAVSGKRDLREITKVVEDGIKENIESLPGVGQVRMIGGRRRQIQVWLDPAKLAAYNLNVQQVRAALAAQNVEIPGGRVDQGNRELVLRTEGRMRRPQDFGRIVVAAAGGSPVRISDVGRVEDGVEEPRTLARLDGQAAVVLEIRKQSGTNTVEVIHAIKDRMPALRAGLPAGFEIAYTRDQSTFIEASFQAVEEHLILGGFFASLIVLFFLSNWRTTLICAVAIPTSIIATYTLMERMGFTLNQITMLALTLVVGIVIDDAIVVLENIFRFGEEKHLNPRIAAVEGTRDIGLAVTATTMSLVIVFLPVAMMGGIIGRFMSSFGYTAAFAVMVSLLVSFTLTPMLSSRYLKFDFDSEKKTSKETPVFRFFDWMYRGMLEWSLRHRWAVMALALAVASTSWPLFLALGKDFLPVDDQSEFEISVRAAPGSSLEGTDAAMVQVEEEVRRLPAVRHVLTVIGADSQRRVDRGSVTVELTPPADRQHDQRALMGMARQRLLRFRDLTVSVQLASLVGGGGMANKDLQFFLQGPDFARMNGYAEPLVAMLRSMPGVADVESSFEPGKPELRAFVSRDKAADQGVTVESVASALRVLVGGDPQATTYREGQDRYDVQLRVDKQFRDSAAALDRLYVPSATLGNVALSSVVSVSEGEGPIQIERSNRQRQITLTANILPGQALSNVLAAVDRKMAELSLPPEYRSGLIGRSREFGRASRQYVIAFALAMVFMYMVLAAQFESFIDPFTILLSLPLAVPFALLSLLLARENFSIIYSSLGILMLFGIVKKNSILQIDHIKSLRRREDYTRHAAIVQGCRDRLRPILMTTAALVAGMFPLALGSGAGAGSRRTVAIVVIGGQSLCLLLTLLVTPVAYALFDDAAHAPVWPRARQAAAAGGAVARRAWAGVLGTLFPFIFRR